MTVTEALCSRVLGKLSQNGLVIILFISTSLCLHFGYVIMSNRLHVVMHNASRNIYVNLRIYVGFTMEMLCLIWMFCLMHYLAYISQLSNLFTQALTLTTPVIDE